MTVSDPSVRERRVIRIRGPVVLMAILLGGGSLVESAPARHHLGEAWEIPLERGVDAQRSAMRRGVSADTLVGRAQRAVRREPSVVKLYLLARAHGERAAVARAKASKAAGPGEKRRLEERAQADYREAMAIYGDVLKKAPRCYYALHDIGVLELQRDPKATRTAFGHLSRGYGINRNYTPIQRQLIQLYLGGRQYAEAIPLLQRLIDLDPEDVEARLRLVSCYAASKKFDLAYAQVDPMIAKTPGNLHFLHTRARLDTQTGKYVRAIATFRRLARANPNVSIAYHGILECLRAIGGSDQKGVVEKLPTANEDALFALKGLLRLERDPKMRKQYDEHIAQVEHRLANPAGSGDGGPPTTEQLLHALEGPDAKLRVQSIHFLWLREEKPTNEVLRAVARHLAPKNEAEPHVRAAAVRALAHMSGTRLIPLIRHALRDPEAGVRIEATDVLAAIAARDAAAKETVLVILGSRTGDRDVVAAAVARAGVLAVAGINLLDVGPESSDAEWRAAFEAWWNSTEGEEILIRALERYHTSGDREPDQVLLPYLATDEFYVFRAVYRALEKAAEQATVDAWKRWYAAMPRFPVERLKKENHASLKSEMDAWVARRPGS